MQKAFEKIVERLEKEKSDNLHIYMNYGLNTDLGRMYGMEKAIKIVNQVAEEYKQEVCEWKKAGVQAGLPFYKTCKRSMPYSMNDDKKFCPYCGKKIKVIE